MPLTVTTPTPWRGSPLPWSPPPSWLQDGAPWALHTLAQGQSQRIGRGLMGGHLQQWPQWDRQPPRNVTCTLGVTLLR